MNFFYVPAGNWIMGPFVKENRYAKPRLADRSRSTNRGFKLCEYWLCGITPYISLHMALHGISDPECRESEVQITSTFLSKHSASIFAYKKSELKKPGNGWCAWVFSGASIPFGKYGCGGRIWTDGLRVMRVSLRKFRELLAQSGTDWTIFRNNQGDFSPFRPTGAPAFFR